MRRFELHRDQDATGVSGVGVVAQGIEFDDGACALRWLTATSSTAVYASAADIITIHGHGGLTRLVWLDRPAIDLQWQQGTAGRALTRQQELMQRLEAIQ